VLVKDTRLRIRVSMSSLMKRDEEEKRAETGRVTVGPALGVEPKARVPERSGGHGSAAERAVRALGPHFASLRQRNGHI
jgi:hypothetical protein